MEKGLLFLAGVAGANSPFLSPSPWLSCRVVCCSSRLFGLCEGRPISLAGRYSDRAFGGREGGHRKEGTAFLVCAAAGGGGGRLERGGVVFCFFFAT